MSETAGLRRTIDELAGRGVQELRQALAREMAAMGWDRLLGKKRGGEQSLLDHSLSVFDVLAACLPFFAEECSPALTFEEARAALIAAVGHDSGKAAPDFQAYLHGTSAKFAEHVEQSVILETVERFAQAAKITLGGWTQDVISSAILHDRRMRRPRGEFAEWERQHVSPRWRKLADIVNHADTLASVENVPAARRFLSKNPTLLAGASVASYQVHLRGVSTTILHEAALAAFQEQGWMCLVYFGDGAVLTSRRATPPKPAEIYEKLEACLRKIQEERVVETVGLAIGRIDRTFLPFPEYVTANNAAELLRLAASRSGAKEFTDVELGTLRRQWHAKFGKAPTDYEISMLGEIGPEIALFKMAKCIFKDVLPTARTKVAGDAPAPNRVQYDEVFGDGAYDRLLQQGNLKRIEDYELCVKDWLARPHSSTQRIADLSPQQRVGVLTTKLLGVLMPLLRTHALPSQKMLRAWTDALAADFLIAQGAPEIAGRQLRGYVALKSPGRRGGLQCCQCASDIASGEDEKGLAAFGNKGSFSNRRLAFAGSGDPATCKRCSTDTKLTQMVLGRSEIKIVIAVIPSRSLGPLAAEHLKERVLGFRSTLDRQLNAATMDLSGELPLWSPARILGKPDAFPECFVQPLFAEGKKRRVERLRESLDELLTDEATKALGFSSCEALATALVDGTVDAVIREDPSVARAVRSVAPGVGFGANSPNLTVVAFDQDLGGSKATDAERAVLSFGLAALLASKLNAAVAVCSPADLRTALGSRNGRAVYVPPNGAVRRMLGADWLPIDPGGQEPDATRWLAGIQGAIRLQRLMSGAGAKAPALFDILRYPNAGLAIQQVEARAQEKVFWPKEWSHIEALKEILR